MVDLFEPPMEPPILHAGQLRTLRSIRSAMVDKHLHGPTRGEHKFTVASMVSLLMGPDAGSVAHSERSGSPTAPRMVAGSGVTVGRCQSCRFDGEPTGSLGVCRLAICCYSSRN